MSDADYTASWRLAKRRVLHGKERKSSDHNPHRAMTMLAVEAPGGVEPPTNGLGNRCSIQLSYGAKGKTKSLSHVELRAI